MTLGTNHMGILLEVTSTPFPNQPDVRSGGIGMQDIDLEQARQLRADLRTQSGNGQWSGPVII